jgi:hypothetical protein
MIIENQEAATTDVTAQAQEQGQEQQQQNWYDGLPDEMKGYVQNKNWDTPLKAVESYRNLEKFQGADKNDILKLPKDENGEYVLDEVYAKIGRPETPEAYKIDGVPDFEFDKERLDLFKGIAHKAGLSQKQLAALVQADVEYNQKTFESYANDIKLKQEAELSELKKEWGAGYDERSELARRFINKNLPDGLNKEETLTKIEEAIGTKAMLKLFGNAGYAFKDDTVPHGANNSQTFGMTREQAIYEKSSLMAEIAADPARLKAFNEGKATSDIEKVNRYNNLIA